MHYFSVSDFCKREYGEKLWKLSLSLAVTCPNRDGSKGTGGCVFCSGSGSGDFAQSPSLGIDEQLELAKKRVCAKAKGRYIAYFQSFTSTYCPLERLEEALEAVLCRDEIAAISVATRPDCLPDKVIELLEKANRSKPVWVELGLQTSNEKTAAAINRCFDNACCEKAVATLNSMGIHTVLHLILGLPFETKADVLSTIDFVNHCSPRGVKLQLLHVLEGTALAKMYARGEFEVLGKDEYIDLLCACIERLSPEIVIHRLTGDGAKRSLIAPLWSSDKKDVINSVGSEFRRRSIVQGSSFKP